MTASRPAFTQSEDGFTLLEIIVVTAIIGVLATIAVVNYAKPREVASDASLQGAVTSVHTAALSASAGKTPGTLTKAHVRPAMISEGIEWDVVDTANRGFCSLAWTPEGEKYPSRNEALTHESRPGACDPEPAVVIEDTTTTETTITETTTTDTTTS